jgi:RNA polymerase sigma-70 factor (ECF subfamily)
VDRPSDLRELDEGDLASHAVFLRRLARKLVRDEASADDVAQETWRAALARPPREAVTWRAWLTTAARNVARQMARGGARRATHEPAAAARERLPSTDEVVARLEAERRLIDAVAALPDDDRALILLRHFDGLPPRMIARRMQAPVETVKTRLKRALERLRERLVTRGGDSKRLHSGLLLVANGLVGKVGATGGVFGGVVAMSAKAKVAVALLAAVAVVAAVQVVRSRADGGARAAVVSRADGDGKSAPRERAIGDVALGASRVADAVAEPRAEAPTPIESDDPPTEITGRVLDYSSWQPIEGVAICGNLNTSVWPPQRYGAADAPSTRTDSEGRFVWRRPPAALGDESRAGWGQESPATGWADAIGISIDVWKPGFKPTNFRVNAAAHRSQDVGDLKLARESRIRGRVEIPESVDGSAAVVFLQRIEVDPMRVVPTLTKPEPWLMRTSCDRAGGFEFGGLGGGKYRLWASLPDSYFTPSDLIPVATGQAVDDVVLRVAMPPDDGATFRVRVVAPDGEPVEGAGVCVSYREGRRASVLTFLSDEHGEVVVATRGLPIPFVEAWAPKDEWLHARREFERDAPEECELRLGEPERITLHVRSADETPLEDVVVDGEQWFTEEARAAGNTQGVGSWHADAAGNVEVRLPKGMVELKIRSDGFVDAKVGPMGVGDARSPIEVALAPAPAFTGRVTFEGRPVAGAVVLVSQSPPAGRVCTSQGATSRAMGAGVHAFHPTDGEGRFRVCWTCDNVIWLHAVASGFAAAEIGPIDAAVSKSASNLEIGLMRGGSIAGVVLPGRDGVRAPYVVLSNGDAYPRSWSVATDGTFHADHLTPGPWNVRAHDAAVPFHSWSGRFDAGPLDVLPSNCVVRDGECTTVTISSDDTLDCIVRGRVTGLCDATTPSWLRRWQAWIGPSRLSDEEIAWHTPGQPESDPFDGDCFQFRRDWCGEAELVLAQRLDAIDRSFVASLRRPWTLKQGITDWSGSFEFGAIEGCVVSCAPESLHVEADATTADGFRYHARVRVRDDGGFTIPRVPAGAVRVRVDGLGVEQTVQVETGATANVALR